MPLPRLTGPLSRFTVIDLARVRSGPTAVRQLADWGARVIKVEIPESVPGGDPFAELVRDRGDFQNTHRNKLGMTLNMKEPEGMDILRQLVTGADVVVENFRPDVKHRLGIDYDAFRAINPGIVYASISGFGQDGPYAKRPGFDQIAQGMGGLMSITGMPGQGPVRAGIAVADLSSGLHCAIGILIALLEREESGEGQWVHTSLLEAQIAMLDFQAARWTVQGEVAEQAGNDHPTTAPTGAYPTADGHINIAATGQAMWRKLCEALGGPELLEDPGFETDRLRRQNRARLNEELGALTRCRTSEEWVESLNAAGVPCGPIYTVDQVFADPQVRHLGIAQPVRRQDGTDVTLVGQPVRLSRTPSKLALPTPERGEHTDAILAELGYDEDRIRGLHTRGVV